MSVSYRHFILDYRQELRAHWVRIIFLQTWGTFRGFPLVTGVGVNFVSSGDEVDSERKFYIFCKKGVRFSGKSVRYISRENFFELGVSFLTFNVAVGN